MQTLDAINPLSEMTDLWLHRPALNAPEHEVAAWYEAKARLHEHLADGGGPDAQQERVYAATAHQHALDLLSASASHWGLGGGQR